MKIQILSDLHNEFIRGELPSEKLRSSDAYIRRKDLCSPAPLSSITHSNSDVVVLAGDIDIGSKGVQWAVVESQILDKDIIYVPGNHEFYRQEYHATLSAMRTMANNTRVHVLEKDSAIINGVRFLGCTLWTDYKVFKGLSQADAMNFVGNELVDHKVIRISPVAGAVDLNFLPGDALKLHEESVEWLKNELAKPFDGATVVVTHHGPSPKCAHYKFGANDISPGFYSDLEYLMGEDVNLWIYGHTHSNLDTMINGTRLVSNQPGYPHETIPRFNGKLVVEI